MKQDATLYTDPIRNINCPFAGSGDSLRPFRQKSTDTFGICPPVSRNLPSTPLAANADLPGNLFYTVVFLIVFAFVRLKGKDLFYNVLNVFVKRKKTEIILNEGIVSNLICYMLSLFLSFSIWSGFLSFMLHGHFLSMHSLYYFSGLTAYHFTLLTLVQLLGWTFNAKNIASEIKVNLWTYHIVSGLVVAPFIISTFFVKSFAISPLLKTVIFSLILLELIKIIRWIEILFIHRVSILYMILYLCTLEIMPLFTAYKIVA